MIDKIDAPQLIAVIRKNNREEFRIRVREFENFRGVDLRVFAQNGEGQMRETPRGVAIRFSALPAIIEALQKAEQLR